VTFHAMVSPSPIPYFLIVYGLLGYEREQQFIESFVILFNAIIDSIDDSIDEVPSEFRQEVYFNQIVIFTGFILVFEQVLTNQLKRIPRIMKKHLNSVKFVQKMRDCVTELINIPIRERELAREIESSKSLEKLPDMICEYLIIRTFHFRLCTLLLDILLNNNYRKEDYIHSHFAAKSLEKDSSLSEIAEDTEKDCSNLFRSLARNSVVNASNSVTIIEKSLGILLQKQKKVIESSKCYKLANDSLLDINTILEKIIKNIEILY